MQNLKLDSWAHFGDFDDFRREIEANGWRFNDELAHHGGGYVQHVVEQGGKRGFVIESLHDAPASESEEIALDLGDGGPTLPLRATGAPRRMHSFVFVWE